MLDDLYRELGEKYARIPDEFECPLPKIPAEYFRERERELRKQLDKYWDNESATNYIKQRFGNKSNALKKKNFVFNNRF